MFGERSLQCYQSVAGPVRAGGLSRQVECLAERLRRAEHEVGEEGGAFSHRLLTKQLRVGDGVSEEWIRSAGSL